MKHLRACAIAAGAALWVATPSLAGTESPTWSAYLDLAYVYSSSDSAALRARLREYAGEAGVPLERYIHEYFETLAPLESEAAEVASRRRAIAYLLDYLARGDPHSLQSSVAAVRELGERLERRENRYWYHYIRAHHALERGYGSDFVDELLQLWLGVVVPIEATYETLDTLALSDAPNSGFVSALPFIYENIARLILLRSQEMGVDRNLDPLGVIVRMLHDGRVGAYPDEIPPEASSRAYLERIVQRLDGPESDDGSLTFTLALFEASKHHDAARSLLASQGLGEDTLRAMRRAASAYEIALNRAATEQGRCAVYTRVLRQLGELYAARQRLGVDPELELPFSIEGAIDVYARLHSGLDGGWRELGFRHSHRQQYLRAMHGLWEEIQEASLNAADFYLTRSVENPHRAHEHARNAARVYTRYLAFFYEFATDAEKEAVPDSAYFAAFEAAKGIGDAYLRYAPEPSRSEVRVGTQRYRSALILFPFDREVWPGIAEALGRHGRESDYAELVRPIVERVVQSRAINDWIASGEANAGQIAALRNALSESVVVMYMGFADGSNVGGLEQELAELVARRDQLRTEVRELTLQRDRLRGGTSPAADPASADEDGEPEVGLAQVAQRLAVQSALLAKLEEQVVARSRGLPLYKKALETDGLTRELRVRRDHPVHTLLRRMYHESGAGARGDGREGS